VETAILALIAMLASLLTFFSGFGLGTILLPVFILFYPVDLSVALTAIVHFLNGLFKFGLMGRHLNGKVALQFGIPALLFAILGASLLVYLSNYSILVQYRLLGFALSTSPVKIIIGVLLFVFALVELFPGSKQVRKGKAWIFWGGALSGFFGGLSGHQGALRSAFLIRFGFSKESFIATGIFIALMIDVSRLPVYLKEFDRREIFAAWPVLLAATLAAFAGAYAGKNLLRKVTLRFVQYLVAVAVVIIGILLGLGFI
jgi:uncharacterized membrane protein YfcA